MNITDILAKIAADQSLQKLLLAYALRNIPDADAEEQLSEILGVPLIDLCSDEAHEFIATQLSV